MLDRITTRRTKETAINVVNAVLGVCLALTPWMLGFAGEAVAAWNALRVEQAEALLAFTEEIRAQSGVQDVLVLGDLNAYGEEDPIDALRAGGLADLLAEQAARRSSERC